MLIIDSYYISNNLDKALEDTELSIDELESIVGKFTAMSSRSGQYRGEVVIDSEDNVKIRHHFTKKILWKK